MEKKHASLVTLAEYGDYECPHCARAYPIIKKLQKDFGHTLQFEFKNFPLVNMHPHALMAADAAECARAQGKFDEMHDGLFENQERLGQKLIVTLAEKIGLDMKKFLAEWSKHVYLPKIEKDMKEAEILGVQGTPSFFINDKAFEDEWTYEILAATLKAQLSRDGTSREL